MLLVKQFWLTCISLLFAANVSAETMLHNMNGEILSFAALKGKWVLINYWASWCQSCIDEIPALNRFYEKNKHKNVALFAVNYDAIPLEMQQKLIKQLDIRYPALKKDPASALKLGDIRGVPATFIFNPKGELSRTLYGSQTVSSLKRALSTARD